MQFERSYASLKPGRVVLTCSLRNFLFGALRSWNWQVDAKSTQTVVALPPLPEWLFAGASTASHLVVVCAVSQVGAATPFVRIDRFFLRMNVGSEQAFSFLAEMTCRSSVSRLQAGRRQQYVKCDYSILRQQDGQEEGSPQSFSFTVDTVGLDCWSTGKVCVLQEPSLEVHFSCDSSSSYWVYVRTLLSESLALRKCYFAFVALSHPSRHNGVTALRDVCCSQFLALLFRLFSQAVPDDKELSVSLDLCYCPR